MTVRLRATLAAVLVALTATACGGGSGAVAWRGLELVLPDGWSVHQQSDTLLYAADGEPGGEPGVRGDLTVAAQLTYEPRTTLDDYRGGYFDEIGADVEVDESITLGDADAVPATRFVYTFSANGIPTREMVVVVPSRSVVMLFQPVPMQGDTGAPEVYLDNVEAFQSILDSLELGAPPDAV